MAATLGVGAQWGDEGKVKVIGPTYADKYGRIGIKVGDLLDEEAFLKKVRRNLAEKNALFRVHYKFPEMKEEDVVGPVMAVLPRLAPLVTDTVRLLHDAMK